MSLPERALQSTERDDGYDAWDEARDLFVTVVPADEVEADPALPEDLIGSYYMG